MAGPTQFVSGETRRWWLGYGSGADGDLTISSNTTEAPIDSACTGTATQTSLSATNASFAVGQAILIHQTRGTGAGQWELNQITGYTAGTITLRSPLYYSYASGAQVRVLPQYKNVTINTGVTYTAKAYNETVGGILAFFANGTVTVTGTITATGKGFLGAASVAANTDGKQGGGSVAVRGTTSTAANGNGGGGGGKGTDPNHSNGGGGGGNAAAGTTGQNAGNAPGAGGSLVGLAALTTLFFGGGGGSGGVNTNPSLSGGGGAGGNGGGVVLIIGKTITVTGSVVSGGASGTELNSGNGGGGGGGAGGSILLKGLINTLGTNLITAPAGAGGATSGGAGAVGRIHLDYVVSISGTTTPTLDATQDLTLRQPIQRRLVI